MDKKRISKEKAIEVILKQKDKGLTYTDTFDVIKRNATLSESSFKIYWNEANVIYSERQEAINAIMIEQRVEIEKEALKQAILTKYERMEISSDIARGDVAFSTVADRIRALDYLSKIEGDYAPSKTDITTNGKDFDITRIYGSDKEA